MHVHGGQLNFPICRAFDVGRFNEVVRSLQERALGHRRAQAAGDSRGRHQDFYGNSAHTEHDVLDPRAYCGVIDYEPTELVITACSGTSLTEVEATLAQHQQMLAFEPPHFGASPTLGGTIASGLAGPRRMASGSVRDFVLGATLMDGHANVLTFGGNVMKTLLATTCRAHSQARWELWA